MQKENKSKLIGYKKHIVSEFLKDRYPYLETSFKNKYNSDEVYHAVFDRSIPKLVEILNKNNLDSIKYREAFMLLNEMVSHQEKKDNMIDLNLIKISIDYLKHKNEDVKCEALNLLGSLITIAKGREIIKDLELENISEILVKDSLKVREICGWMLNRLATGRDGIDILNSREINKYIIRSFKKNSEGFKLEESKFLIYLLECVTQILQLDDGQTNFIGTGFIKKITEILKNILLNKELFGNYTQRIINLCLHSLVSIQMNQYGKEEVIKNKVIEVANKFIEYKNLEIVNNAIRIIMFSTINLEGKKQAIDIENDELIKNLKSLLSSEEFDIVINCQYTLINISENPKGMILIVKYLSNQINELENIYGVNSIFALYELWEDLNKDPVLNKNNLESFKNYGYCISYFILHKKYSEEACNYTIEKCCKIVNRWAPLMQINDDLDFQNFLANAIYKICKIDDINKESLVKYLDLNGYIECNLFKTSIKKEFLKYDKIISLIYNIKNN